MQLFLECRGLHQHALTNRLRGLRTQLGRVQGLLLSDDLEGAKVATEQLLSIQQIRQTIDDAPRWVGRAKELPRP